MKLVIPKQYSYRFCLWLRYRLLVEIMSKVEKRPYELYESQVKELYGLEINTYRTVKLIYNLFTINSDKDNYFIQLNPHKKYPKSDVTILSLLNLFNYGNLAMKGYMAISDTFEDVNANLGYYFRRYDPVLANMLGVR